MKQMLFFNGIDVPGHEFTVDQSLQDTGLVFANAAYPPATLWDYTTMAAKVALYLVFLKLFIKGCFHDSSIVIRFSVKNPVAALEVVFAW